MHDQDSGCVRIPRLDPPLRRRAQQNKQLEQAGDGKGPADSWFPVTETEHTETRKALGLHDAELQTDLVLYRYLRAKAWRAKCSLKIKLKSC